MVITTATTSGLTVLIILQFSLTGKLDRIIPISFESGKSNRHVSRSS